MNIGSTPAKAIAKAKPILVSKTSQEEARFRRKATKIWKSVATKETQVNLLRKLKNYEVGTRKVEEFMGDLRGDKFMGGDKMSGTHKKNKKNNKTKN